MSERFEDFGLEVDSQSHAPDFSDGDESEASQDFFTLSSEYVIRRIESGLFSATVKLASLTLRNQLLDNLSSSPQSPGSYLLSHKFLISHNMKAESKPADPLPERGQDESLPDYILRVITPADRGTFEADVQSIQQSLHDLYAEEPRAIDAINKECDLLHWRFFGQPNEPLPEALYIFNFGMQYPQVYQYAFRELDPICHKHEAERYEALYKHSQELTDVIAEDLREQPIYHYLKSFAAPVPRRTIEELPLDQNQRARRIAEITSGLTRQYGMSVGELQRPTNQEGFNPHRQYVRAIAQLDYELEPQIHLEHTDSQEDPYDRLLRAIKHEIAALWSAEHGRIVTDEDVDLTQDRNTILGEPFYLNSYIEKINKLFESPYDMPDISTCDMLSRMLDAALQDTRKPYLAQLESTVQRRADRRLHTLFSDEWSAPISLQEQVWIRRPLLPEPSPHPACYKPNAYRRQAPLSIQELVDRLAIEAGSVVHDTRDDNIVRLIAQLPAGEVKPQSVAEPDLTIVLTSFSAQKEPYIPGFVLRATRHWQSDETVIFDFTKDANDPYEDCNVIIPEEMLDRAARAYSNRGFYNLAHAVRELTNATVSDLVATVRGNMIYNTAPTYGEPIEDIEGQPYVQCVGADEMLRVALDTIFPHSARMLYGLVLNPRGETSIRGLGHQQTLFVHKGRRYILDATPSMSEAIERMQELARHSESPQQTLPPHHMPEDPSPYISERVDTPKPARRATPEDAARKAVAGASAAAESIRVMFESSIRTRLNIHDDPRFAQRENFYQYVLDIAKKPDEPLRSAFNILLDVVRTEPTRNSATDTRRAIQDTQQIINGLMLLPAKDRAHYASIADDATLQTVRAMLRQLLTYYDRLEWAFATLDAKLIDGVAPRPE